MKLEQLVIWTLTAGIIILQCFVIFRLTKENDLLQQGYWKIAQWHGEDLKKCVRIGSPI